MGAVKGMKLIVHECPKCGEFRSKRITSFEKHLFDSHKIVAKELWAEQHGGGKCRCGCGKDAAWRGWGKGFTEFVKGHNANIYSAYSQEEAEVLITARKASMRGKPSWCKNLTKDTDERVAKRGLLTSAGRKAAFDEGRIEAWNKGHTKHDDSRIAKEANVLKAKYASGELTPWAKGLTKNTDQRVARMAASVSLVLQQKEIRNRLDSMKRLDLEEVRTRVEETGLFQLVDGLDDYKNRSAKVIVVKCKTCGEIITGSINSLWHGKCFKCSPGGSTAQEMIAIWLESIGCKVNRNDRVTLSGHELDIYIPAAKFAIEYNGLYWHSHIHKTPQYHENKTKLAHSRGVSLFHVFEDEWRNKRQIIESIAKRKLDLLNNIMTIKTVKKLSNEEKKTFLSREHLDGDSSASFSIGAIDFDDSIIAVLSIRSTTDSTNRGEIVRYCQRHDIACSDAVKLSLLEEVRKESILVGYDSLITYVDTRLGGEGLGYVRAGFKETGRTPSRWWWTDMNDRFNRFKFKADKASGRTEAQVAADAGVVKIWGCENVIYELKLDQVTL